MSGDGSGARQDAVAKGGFFQGDFSLKTGKDRRIDGISHHQFRNRFQGAAKALQIGLRIGGGV